MKKGLLLILLIFALMPAQAQDEAEPLLEMLVHLPEVTEGSPIVAYADIELALSAWLEVPEVNSLADFEALDESERNLYIRSLPVLMPGFVIFAMSTNRLEEFSEGYGFDIFSIEHSMYLRNTSYQEPFIALHGDFDEDAIIERQLAAGYGQHGDDNWTVLCPQADCESDFVSNRELLLNGGFIVRDNLFINTMSPDYLRESEEIMYGAAAARLDVPEYFAPTRLLMNSGAISQVTYIEPDYIAELNEMRGADGADVETLPPYGLVTMAELVVAEEQITEVHIILSYANAEDAEIAAENLEANLENPDTFNRTHRETLEVELESVEVSQEPVSEVFLVRAILSSPSQQDGSGLSTSSLFRLVHGSTFTFFEASWLLVED